MIYLRLILNKFKKKLSASVTKANNDLAAILLQHENNLFDQVVSDRNILFSYFVVFLNRFLLVWLHQYMDMKTLSVL